MRPAMGYGVWDMGYGKAHDFMVFAIFHLPFPMQATLFQRPDRIA
jgi:hypothetical protein